MACHAALLETDGLSAFGTGFPKQTLCVFTALFIVIILKISIFKDATYSIRDGKYEAIFLEHRVFSSYAL
jgi:hypothetical protein